MIRRAWEKKMIWSTWNFRWKMTRCTHDCWHARINKRVECVRTHSCMYGVFPESVKRASPFARLFPSRRFLWFITTSSLVSTCIALPSGPVSLLASHISPSTVHQLAMWCAKPTFSRQFTRLSLSLHSTWIETNVRTWVCTLVWSFARCKSPNMQDRVLLWIACLFEHSRCVRNN